MRFDGGGAIRIVGRWRQSPPLDLSAPEIRWYTWGFEGTVLFVANAEWSGGLQGRLTINGQACSAEVCARIDDLVLDVQATPADFRRAPTIALDGLVEVAAGS